MKYYTPDSCKCESVVKGSKISKVHPVFDAIGTVDELNSSVGLARVATGDKNLNNLLKHIQNKLFTIGAELGYEGDVKITSDDVKFIEDTVDKYAEAIEDVNYFVYPTGSQLAVYLHVCRTICRRAERMLFNVSEQEKLTPELLGFVNRLSSLFYVLARFANKQANVKDEKWR